MFISTEIQHRITQLCHATRALHCPNTHFSGNLCLLVDTSNGRISESSSTSSSATVATDKTNRCDLSSAQLLLRVGRLDAHVPGPRGVLRYLSADGQELQLHCPALLRTHLLNYAHLFATWAGTPSHNHSLFWFKNCFLKQL